MMLHALIQANDGRSDLLPAADPFGEGSTTPGFNFFAALSRLFSGEGAGFLGSVFGFLGLLWTIYAVVAYLFAILFLALFVYASVNKKLYQDLQAQERRDMEQLYAEQFTGARKQSRLRDVLDHIESDNPSNWKLAIIEADIILDGVLKERGYQGSSLGERLKSISGTQLASLNDAWEAHKIRNRIAHDGADFVLTKRIAQETIQRYQRVFAEFGVS